MCEKKTLYALEFVAEIDFCMDIWLWLMAMMTIVMLMVTRKY